MHPGHVIDQDFLIRNLSTYFRDLALCRPFFLHLKSSKTGEQLVPHSISNSTVFILKNLVFLVANGIFGFYLCVRFAQKHFGLCSLTY